MLRSFFNAVTGMDTSRFWIDVTSDNLANVNTVGFKGQRPIFQDAISSVTVGLNTVTGTLKSTTYGAGSVVDSTQKLWTIGNFKQTGINTDLAIQGRGLFILDDPVSQTRYYTRDGQFRLSRDGYMVNSAGLKLQGFKVDDQGNTIGTTPEDIRIETQLPPQATSEISFLQPTNLNADAPVKTAPFDALNPDTYNYKYSITIYDSLGKAIPADFYFRKTGGNQWEVYMISVFKESDIGVDIGPPAGTPDGDTSDYVIIDWFGDSITVSNTQPTSISGTANQITFDPDTGRLIADGAVVQGPDTQGRYYIQVNVATINNNYNPSNSNATFGSNDTLSIYVGEGDLDVDGNSINDIANSFINQFSGDFVVTMDQNGYTKGDLIDVFVLSEDGAVVGVYSNGKSKPLYRVAVAVFTDTEELIKKGANLYTSITAPTILVPGGSEKIRSGMLEMSNVDIAKEFINLITAQRAYQANARVVTTSNTILDETVNLVR